MNAITSFVDASNVYGSHPSDNNILRNSGMPGSLKVTRRVNKKDILPEVEGEFRAGDARAREMPGLLSMHTIWMREHNRIGKKGTQKNRNCSHLMLTVFVLLNTNITEKF